MLPQPLISFEAVGFGGFGFKTVTYPADKIQHLWGIVDDGSEDNLSANKLD